MVLYKRYAKGYLNCIYDMNYDVEIKSEYCYSGLDASEVLEYFAAYRNVIISIFDDMANTDNDFHMAKDETDRDTILYPIKSIFAFLYAVGSAGILFDDEIVVNCMMFKVILQNVKRKYINVAVSILKDYGFMFEGNILGKDGEFTVHYPDSNKVLFGLYSFTKTIQFDINTMLHIPSRFLLMDSRLYAYSRNEAKPYDFMQELFRFVKAESERKAILAIHDRMIEHNLKSGALRVDTFNSDDMNPGAYIRYDFAQFEPRAVIRANPSNKTSRLGIWMKNMANQSDYLQKCLNDFKQSCDKKFDDCPIAPCKHGRKNRENCKGRLIFTINDKIYEKCTYNAPWGYSGNNAIFKLDENEIDTYMYFIKLFDDK